MEEAVEEDFRPTLFVTGDVVLTPCNKFGECFPARRGEVLKDGARGGKLAFHGQIKTRSLSHPVRLVHRINLRSS
jgi:hypothetical protein